MNDRKLKISAALLFVACLVVSGRAAQAQQSDAEATQSAADPCLQKSRCKDLYDGARKLSQSQQYEAALVMYQSAYALEPRPWLLVNIGRMQQKLGHPDQAIVSFKRFLDDPMAAADPDFSTRAQAYLNAAERERTEQEAKLRPPPIAVLTAPAVRPPSARPLYKKWWLWTVVGGAVALTAVGLGVGIGLASQTQVGVPAGVSAFYPTF